jgi:D-alanine-D-alanine ligase-like ATP-grasp enzyme
LEYAILLDEIREIALKAYKVTRCKGVARIDFLIKIDYTFV